MPSDLRHLAELQAKATPAPWDEIISSEAVRYLGPTVDDVTHGDYICAVYDPRGEENKAFIAAARNTDFAAMAERLEFMEESLRDAVRLINHLGGNPANQKKALALCAALTEETEADHE